MDVLAVTIVLHGSEFNRITFNGISKIGSLGYDTDVFGYGLKDDQITDE